jgi:hypothetical protein
MTVASCHSGTSWYLATTLENAMRTCRARVLAIGMSIVTAALTDAPALTAQAAPTRVLRTTQVLDTTYDTPADTFPRKPIAGSVIVLRRLGDTLTVRVEADGHGVARMMLSPGRYGRLTRHIGHDEARDTIVVVANRKVTDSVHLERRVLCLDSPCYTRRDLLMLAAKRDAALRRRNEWRCESRKAVLRSVRRMVDYDASEAESMHEMLPLLPVTGALRAKHVTDHRTCTRLAAAYAAQGQLYGVRVPAFELPGYYFVKQDNGLRMFFDRQFRHVVTLVP